MNFCSIRVAAILAAMRRNRPSALSARLLNTLLPALPALAKPSTRKFEMSLDRLLA
jgi:hypothetical protein